MLGGRAYTPNETNLRELAHTRRRCPRGGLSLTPTSAALRVLNRVWLNTWAALNADDD
jgi:hypothetical protein